MTNKYTYISQVGALYRTLFYYSTKTAFRKQPTTKE